ncbi:cyclase family protein [Streptomyces sp. SID3343]|uniref:cyclase family protein n=1 Tax=Streptomyces sp. SID3343 TaxID=2690260 RepID=UPI00136920B3|nr:cyclase family protein [Streptomyces sp. SID3343]MYW04702.1 cyclase family protein [Streptomyces sp. SID3343]
MDSPTRPRDGADDLLRNLGIPTKGTVYDLSSGWWRHMPAFGGYPRFEVVTYSSPQGQRTTGEFPFDNPDENQAQVGYVSEFVSGGLHTGTHIDALCHITCGDNDEWHGGVSANDALGNYGAERGDASELAPVIGRGVLLDVPAALGLDILPPHFAIGEEHLRAAAEAADVSVQDGDIVLVRTGQMKYWPDIRRIRKLGDGSGVALDGARWLVSQGARYVGADTLSFEVMPSPVPGNPFPVHLYLLHERGMHIMEWVNCEALAADKVSSFLFIGLPLTIRGGTGSPLRPIAVT